jgi:hypothetical protein
MLSYRETLGEISAKVVLAVAAVCDRRRFSSKFGCCRRSQSAATGLKGNDNLTPCVNPKSSWALVPAQG